MSDKPRRIGRSLPALAVLALLLCMPLIGNGYVLFIVSMMCVNALMALGFNFVIGFLRQLVFANTTFFGIGAYAYAILVANAGLPFPVAFFLACAAGGTAGLVVGLPALRLRSFQLAIVTLAFNQLMYWVYLHSGSIGGGPSGLSLPGLHVFGLRMNTPSAQYLLILFVTLAGIWTIRNLARSTLGRAVVSVGAHELAAASLTISTIRYRVTAFMLSGLYSAAAGALFAILLGRVAPESFEINQLLAGFAMVLVGGLGTVSGPVLGAILLTGAPELLRSVPGAEELLYSLLLIVLLLLMPKGIFGGLCQLIPTLRERFRGVA